MSRRDTAGGPPIDPAFLLRGPAEATAHYRNEV